MIPLKAILQFCVFSSYTFLVLLPEGFLLAWQVYLHAWKDSDAIADFGSGSVGANQFQI